LARYNLSINLTEAVMKTKTDILNYATDHFSLLNKGEMLKIRGGESDNGNDPGYGQDYHAYGKPGDERDIPPDPIKK
jgi:hypothetical protein